MTENDLLALFPIVVLAAAIVLILLVAAFGRNHALVATLSILGLGLAFAALFLQSPSVQVTPLLIMDGYARFFIGLILFASAIVALLAYGYLSEHSTGPEEFYVLLVLATLGGAVLAASSHFASFFLGLEILSVSLYALIAYLRAREHSVEGGLKYLVLAGTSSAFLLFGMALVYAETGTMELRRLAALPVSGNVASNFLLLPGLAMIIVGIGFKLAVVPFHLWTPDVYEGSPAPATAFIATVSKGAMFALLLRYFTQFDVRAYQSLFIIFALIALASMLIGNLLALFQNNVKRILAYSSIAHLGYLLVAFLASGPLAATAVAFYLVTYFITTLGAFAVVTVLSARERDADKLQDYRGLFYRDPLLAGIMTAMLLSLAGIPLTAGFVGKFFLVAAGVSTGLWLLVVVLVISSAIGLFYYLRVIVAMVGAPASDETYLASPSRSIVGGLVLAVLVVLLVLVGVYPTPLVQLVQAAVAGLS